MKDEMQRKQGQKLSTINWYVVRFVLIITEIDKPLSNNSYGELYEETYIVYGPDAKGAYNKALRIMSLAPCKDLTGDDGKRYKMDMIGLTAFEPIVHEVKSGCCVLDERLGKSTLSDAKARLINLDNVQDMINHPENWFNEGPLEVYFGDDFDSL